MPNANPAPLQIVIVCTLLVFSIYLIFNGDRYNAWFSDHVERAISAFKARFRKGNTPKK